MDGFLIINKPSGMTSMDVISRLRRILQTTKIGHTGTLDPMATGVLVCGVGKATKLLGYLENEVKTYEAEIKLGIETDTYDITGEIVGEYPNNSNNELIDKALEELKESTTQIPPMYSAIKKDGKKLYELARKGIEIEREARPIKIDYLKRSSNLENDLVSFKVIANKGFYVRSLVHDLGIKLETHATMTKLNRIQAGKYTLEDSIKLDELSLDNLNLISIEDVYSNYPKIEVNDYMHKLIKNGVTLDGRQIKTNSIFRVYSKNQLIALYEPISEEKYKIIVYLGD